MTALLSLTLMPLTQMFEWKTSAIKFVSCACCVGAGLPVGPEGPMIFLGATLGGLVSQGTINAGLLPRKGPRERAESILTFFGYYLWPFKRFRNKVDQRDFMTAGCAAGVAGAFGAPIGGLLFAMEEVASFWNVTLGWQIFFACMTAVFARAVAESLSEGETPGLFSNTIAYEVVRPVKTHVYAMFVAVFVGAACGLTASLFTRTNLKVSQWRSRYVGANKRKRFIEPLAYMFVFATIALTLPFAFNCREAACFVNAEAGIECVSAPANPLVMQTVVETTMETFICRSDVQAAFRGRDGTSTLSTGLLASSSTESDATGYVYKYNELATLMQVSGNEALVHLLSRNTHLEFGFASICVFFVVYYFFAAIVAGSCIASGLFVPMLLMGACIGRFWGLVAVHAGLRAGLTPADFQTEEWSWIDPGVFAMVGAGAYMAGVSRLTLSLAVIVMEMTNEVHFLLPLLLAIMVAKWVADALEHALYHSLLEFKNVPFLPATPFGGATLDMLSVRDIMCAGPVVTLRETESLLSATDVLRRTKVHAFPVVRSTHEGDVYVGMITREHLTMILFHAAMVATGQALPGVISYDQLEGKASVVAPIAGKRATDAKVQTTEEMELKVIGSPLPAAKPAPGGANGHGHAPGAGGAGGGGGGGEEGDAAAEAASREVATLLSGDVDLRAYINRSGVSVPHHFSAMRTFSLFRTMGLRHLPVVDEHNHVVGIVTRKELLDESLGEKLHKLGIGGGH